MEHEVLNQYGKVYLKKNQLERDTWMNMHLKNYFLLNLVSLKLE
jgi:hypothetical protein